MAVIEGNITQHILKDNSMSNTFKISMNNGLVELTVRLPDGSVDIFTSKHNDRTEALKSIWRFINDGRRSQDGVDYLHNNCINPVKFRGEKTFIKAAEAELDRPKTLGDVIQEVSVERPWESAPSTAHTVQERPDHLLNAVVDEKPAVVCVTDKMLNKVIETLQCNMGTHQYRLTRSGAVMVGGHKDGKLTRRYHPKYSKTAAQHGEILFSVDSEGLDFNDPEIADHENSYVYLTPEYFYRDRFCFMYGRLSGVKGRLHYTVIVHHKEIGTFRSKKRAKKALQQAKNMIMVRGEARNISEFL